MRVSPAGGSVSNGYIIPDLEEIRHEELINSEEFMTVIPTLVPDDSADVNSILLFRLNDKLETVLFSAYPDSNSTNDEFSGIFLVRTLDKHILRGFRFEGGYMTALLLPREDNGSSVHRRNAVKRRYQVVDYDYDIYLDEFVVTANKPHSIYIPFLAESVYQDFYGGGVGGDIYDVYYSPGVTGGGGHSGKPKPEEEGKKLVDLFSGREKDLKKLEEMLKKLIEDCLGEGLYKNLLSALNGQKIEFQFNDGLDGLFTVKNGIRSISIGKDMDPDQLMHEMFHAYQSYQESIPSFNNAKLNIEIEAHYAQYIYLSRQSFYKGSEWEDRDEVDSRRKAIKDLGDVIDEQGVLRPGVEEYVLDLRILNTVVPAFRTSKEYKNYSLDYDRVGENNFKNLRKIIKNCK